MKILHLITTHLSKLLPSNVWLRSIFINFLIWGSLLTFGAWGNYLDVVKTKKDLHFSSMWMNWVENDFLLFVLCCWLYPLLGKYPKLIANQKNIAFLFISLALLYYPLHVLFQFYAQWNRFNLQLHHNSFFDFVLSTRNSAWFFCFAYFAAIVIIIIFVRLWNENRARQAAFLQIQTDNLKLNLALEQQKLQSLRQQLEPHFIFNSLNAISALVRTNEQAIALLGIQRLSDLLRYALTASNKNWVSFKEELDFIRDYLALQQLRYGERLEVSIDINEGDEANQAVLLYGDCLPLFLQPLIENALRHDLDCHEGHSKISLQLNLDQHQVRIQLHNRVHAPTIKNPGLGLGLTQTRLRLQMMYQGQAIMQIKQSEHDFTLDIRLPLNYKDYKDYKEDKPHEENKR
jgi:two-component system sensor histidine kinase AlgZ